jgi:hypothetical protein
MIDMDIPTIDFSKVYDELDERREEREEARSSQESSFFAGKPHPEQLSLIPAEVDDKTIDDLFEGLRKDS